MTRALIEVCTAYPVPASVAVVVLAALGVWGLVAVVRGLLTALNGRRGEGSGPSGAPLFYLVAAMSTGVSVNTSWRFFAYRLHITNVAERVAMFAVLEAAFVACAYAMRANVRRPGGQPGAPRTVAWTLTLLSAYMAIAESDFWEGLARVALGPVLGIVALHLALGVEIRQVSPEQSTPWAQLVREMRERALSRFGLANDDRDAATRTRHRAAVRAARLAAAEGGWLRKQRLARAVRVAGVAHDPQTRTRMLAELAALKSLDDLSTLHPASPWGSRADDEPSTAAAPTAEPTTAPVAETTPTARAAADHRGTPPGAQADVRPGDAERPPSPAVASSTGPASLDVQSAVVQSGPVVQRGVQPSTVPPSNPPALNERPTPAPAVQPVQPPALPAGGSDGQRAASSGGMPQRDRARTAARRYAARHGQWPTVTQLMDLADVARGTAGNALKELREHPSALQVVPDTDDARTQP